MSSVAHLVPEQLQYRTPRTVRELVEYLALTGDPYDMFHCMQGVPRAYMEIPSGSPHLMCIRGVYVTLGYWTNGSRQDCEAMLVSTIWDVFVTARAILRQSDWGGLLFWRRMPEITEENYPEGVDANGSPVPGGLRTKLTCRVWIPGVDLSHLCRNGKELTYAGA